MQICQWAGHPMHWPPKSLRAVWKCLTDVRGKSMKLTYDCGGYMVIVPTTSKTKLTPLHTSKDNKQKDNQSVGWHTVATTAMDTYGGEHLWGRTPMGVLPQGALGGAPQVGVHRDWECQCCLSGVPCFSVCLCVQIKTTPGVMRCMGHGSCVNLKPGLLSHSFRTIRHNTVILYLTCLLSLLSLSFLFNIFIIFNGRLQQVWTLDTVRSYIIYI